MMTDLDLVLEAGSLLIIEMGEYSDKDWEGPVRVLKAFTKREASDRFRAEWKPESEWDPWPSPRDFLPWLVANGYVEAIDGVHSWHVGYGEFEP